MKFTKLTSSVLAGATLLSIVAPTATFAATSTHGSIEATKDNGKGAKAGLPQTGDTQVGISFGDNTPEPNEGYLRLQMVPETLDFGNHYGLNDDALDFVANGKNVDLQDNEVTENNRNAGFNNTEENKTTTLKTTDGGLADVQDTAWTTVVDKQVTRKVTAEQAANKTDDAAGTWHLSVKGTDQLHAVDDKGNALPTTGAAAGGNEVTGAILSFNNTKYGQTQDVYSLTGEAQDASYEADLAALATAGTAPTSAKVTGITAGTEAAPISMTLEPTTGVGTTVATAAAGEGQGANVFGWLPEDIKLSMPQGAKVNNAIYKANLTWTLTSDLM